MSEARKLGVDFRAIRDESFISIESRLQEMDRSGIDKQVLGLTVPGVDFAKPTDSLVLAKIVNDELARIADNDDRFISLASLPMLNKEGALEELDRSINELGLKGVAAFSNVAGKPIDIPEFWPIFKRISEMNVPVFVHPIAPKHSEIFSEYSLLAILGFPFDTTLAATRLALSGILEKFPDLVFVLSHLGGTLPFLVGRVNDGYRMLPDEKRKLSNPPGYYLKQMYLDTTSFYKPALDCSYAFWGADKLLLGSDFPYGWVGELKRTVTSIEELEISQLDKEKIYHLNAKKVLKLE
jgi:aminocarboxymuconate-semialdehyde decarboxylase